METAGVDEEAEEEEEEEEEEHETVNLLAKNKPKDLSAITSSSEFNNNEISVDTKENCHHDQDQQGIRVGANDNCSGSTIEAEQPQEQLDSSAPMNMSGLDELVLNEEAMQSIMTDY